MRESNLTCHWCRISKNRKRNKTIKYIPCISCRKIYCEPCTFQYPDILPSIYGCLYCQRLCCCLVKCKQEHKCCYNSRRSLKNHEEKLQFHEEIKLINNRENIFLSKLIEYLEPEFRLMEEKPIDIIKPKPIPLRSILVFSRPNLTYNSTPFSSQKQKHVTWNF